MPAAMPTPRMTGRLIRLAVFVAVIPAAALLTASIASAVPASYKGSSADGKAVFFETSEPMVPGDTDTKRDVYMRSYDAEPGIKSYVTREVSLGPAGGNDAYNALFEKASADGNLVFFSTAESLVEADTDHSSDVYMRNMVTGTTTLVSVGEPACAPACGNGPVDAGFAGGSADGGKAFFVSEEKLAATDTDSSVDVYVRDLAGETTKLVSRRRRVLRARLRQRRLQCRLARHLGRRHASLLHNRRVAVERRHRSAVDIYARNLSGETTTLASQGGEGCCSGLRQQRRGSGLPGQLEQAARGLLHH